MLLWKRLAHHHLLVTSMCHSGPVGVAGAGRGWTRAVGGHGSRHRGVRNSETVREGGPRNSSFYVLRTNGNVRLLVGY